MSAGKFIDFTAAATRSLITDMRRITHLSVRINRANSTHVHKFLTRKMFCRRGNGARVNYFCFTTGARTADGKGKRGNPGKVAASRITPVWRIITMQIARVSLRLPLESFNTSATAFRAGASARLRRIQVTPRDIPSTILIVGYRGRSLFTLLNIHVGNWSFVFRALRRRNIIFTNWSDTRDGRSRTELIKVG